MVKKAAQATPNHLLRRARLERGWTQKVVADRIGTPNDMMITRWERGTASLRIVEPKHAVVLGLRIAHDVLTGHGAPSVRVGMHHGPAIERNGDYIGATVNLAARISAAASGGDVLLSAETAALAPRIEGVLYESRGRQALRNIRDPVELVAAVRQGHPSDQGLAIDPVCQMAVDPERSAGRLNYNDGTYFFCTLACAGEFARHPERFMA